MKKEEFERLGEVLDENNMLLNFIKDVLDFSLLFSDITEFRKFLIMYHDCVVDIHNKGVDTYRQAKKIFKHR